MNQTNLKQCPAIYYFCKQRRASGSVFQRGYKSLPVEDERYLLECGSYIERNPVKAGMAQSAGEYKHSSFKHYTTGIPDEIVTPSPAFLGLAGDPIERRRIYYEYVTESRIQEEMLENGALRF